MTRHENPSVDLAAPRATAALAALLGIGLLAQGAFAGAFVGGRHQWLTWHEHLGEYLLLVPCRPRSPPWASSCARSTIAYRRRSGSEPAPTRPPSPRRASGDRAPVAVAPRVATRWPN